MIPQHMKRILICISVAVVTVACSSGSSKASRSSGSTVDAGVVTAQSTAEKIGCNGFAVDAAGDRELFVADSGSCDLNGHKLTIYRFSNTASRDNWIKTATQFGIGRFVVFDRGVVTSDDQSSADAVKGKVGGEVRTS